MSWRDSGLSSLQMSLVGMRCSRKFLLGGLNGSGAYSVDAKANLGYE